MTKLTGNSSLARPPPLPDDLVAQCHRSVEMSWTSLSAGEDPGWVAEVCGTSEQMIFEHYRTWMPKLRRGDGRQLIRILGFGSQNGP